MAISATLEVNKPWIQTLFKAIDQATFTIILLIDLSVLVEIDHSSPLAPPWSLLATSWGGQVSRVVLLLGFIIAISRLLLALAVRVSDRFSGLLSCGRITFWGGIWRLLFLLFSYFWMRVNEPCFGCPRLVSPLIKLQIR
jgi:hypothetical protein